MGLFWQVWIRSCRSEESKSRKGLKGLRIFFEGGDTDAESIPADGAVLLLPVYGEKVRQGLRGSASLSDLGAAPHLPAGILSP